MSTQKIKLHVNGMTCTGCEEHVESALKSIGAKNVTANFRQGEALFELPEDIEVEKAKEAVNDANYKAGKTEVISQQVTSSIDINNDNNDFDLIIIGSGGGAFSAAIKAVEYRARVAMIERGNHWWWDLRKYWMCPVKDTVTIRRN